MTFLKKLGGILLKGTQIIMGFAPLVQAMVPGSAGIISEINQIAAIIAQVEIMGQALGVAGPDKLRAAAPAVAQIILQSSMMAHRQIADPLKFNAACATIAGGMADLLNSLKPDVETVDKA
jgi:hypothetical protein